MALAFFFFSAFEKVRAGTTAVGEEEEVFLDITEPVWTPASESEGRLVGQHRFPFSITLPRDATIAPVPQAAPKSFMLPPTFSERASPAYIDYRLFVTVRRGRLRVDKQCVPRLVLSLHHRARRLTAIVARIQVVDEFCVSPAQRGETAICAARTRVCRRRCDPWPRCRPRRLEGVRPCHDHGYALRGTGGQRAVHGELVNPPSLSWGQPTPPLSQETHTPQLAVATPVRSITISPPLPSKSIHVFSPVLVPEQFSYPSVSHPP